MLRQTLLSGKLFAKAAFGDANSGFSKLSKAVYTHVKREAEEKRSFTKLAILNGAFLTCDDLVLQRSNILGFQCVLWSTPEFGKSFKDFPGHLERLSSCSFQGSVSLKLWLVWVVSFFCPKLCATKIAFYVSLKYLSPEIVTREVWNISFHGFKIMVGVPKVGRKANMQGLVFGINLVLLFMFASVLLFPFECGQMLRTRTKSLYSLCCSLCVETPLRVFSQRSSLAACEKRTSPAPPSCTLTSLQVMWDTSLQQYIMFLEKTSPQLLKVTVIVLSLA